MDHPFEYTKYPDSEKPLSQIWDEFEQEAQQLKESLYHDDNIQMSEFDFDKDPVVFTFNRFKVLFNIIGGEKIRQIRESDNARRGRGRLIQEIHQAELLLEFAILKSKMWPQRKEIQVYFIGGTRVNINKVMQFAQEWSLHCNIKFRETTDQNASDVRVSFANLGHWSYLGTDALKIPKTEATVNFEVSDVPNDRDFRRVVLHEFGHVLGLIHEHQSPYTTLTWRKDFIYRVLRARYGWSKEDVDINLFDAYENERKMYSPLDSLSIMAYEIPANFTEEGIIFPLNYDLSDVDKKYIGTLYPKLLLS